MRNDGPNEMPFHPYETQDPPSILGNMWRNLGYFFAMLVPRKRCIALAKTSDKRCGCFRRCRNCSRRDVVPGDTSGVSKEVVFPSPT